MEQLGSPYQDTREANPGEVWEENEFWIELSWRIDPDGSSASAGTSSRRSVPARRSPVTSTTRWLFAHSVPGLPEAAEAQGLTPLAYMRKYGVFEIAKDVTASTSGR